MADPAPPLIPDFDPGFDAINNGIDMIRYPYTPAVLDESGNPGVLELPDRFIQCSVQERAHYAPNTQVLHAGQRHGAQLEHVLLAYLHDLTFADEPKLWRIGTADIAEGVEAGTWLEVP